MNGEVKKEDEKGGEDERRKKRNLLRCWGEEERGRRRNDKKRCYKKDKEDFNWNGNEDGKKKNEYDEWKWRVN